jgi:hypothetical protein
MLSLFTCTSRAWRTPEVVLGAVGQALAGRVADGPVVKLDDASLVGIKKVGAAPAHRLVDLKDLLRENTEAYEPDAHAVHRLMSGLSGEMVLVLDGGAFPYDPVSKMLEELRTAMFTMPDWPSALVLVVREQSIDIATTELHSAFYLVPTRRSIAEASLYAYRLHRAAAYARLFMWSQTATGRAFSFSNRIQRLKKALFKRDEADFV